MTVTSVSNNLEALTMTVTAQFASPIARVWQLWADPRQLERWRGPPTYPATVVDHDLSPGGTVTYFMTGPGGEKPRGWWRVLSVDAPWHLAVLDGFAHDDGHPNTEMPTMTFHVTLDELPEGGTRMVIESRFPSRESMEQIIAMGMEEGITLAVGQIDALLLETTAH